MQSWNVCSSRDGGNFGDRRRRSFVRSMLERLDLELRCRGDDDIISVECHPIKTLRSSSSYTSSSCVPLLARPPLCAGSCLALTALNPRLPRTDPAEMSTFSQLVEAIIAEQIDLSTAAETLHAQLSPKEKLWLLDGDSTALSFVGRFLKEGYCFRPHNAGIVKRLGIPGIRFTDGPRGILMGRNSTAFPTSSTRACTWDPKLEERVVCFRLNAFSHLTH